MSADKGKVHRRSGVQRRSAIRDSKNTPYGQSGAIRKSKREGSFFCESGEVLDVVRLTETKPSFSEIKEKFECVKTTYTSKNPKSPPLVLPKPAVSAKVTSRLDCGLDDDCFEENRESLSPISATLPTHMKTAKIKPSISPKPPRKPESVTSEGQTKPDTESSPVSNFPDIHEKLKSTLFPTGVAHKYPGISGAVSNGSSARSSNRSVSSQSSVRSNRDSGMGSSITDAQHGLAILDIEEEEPNLERCNSLEDLPIEEQVTESINENEFIAMMDSSMYVTIVDDLELESSTNTITAADENVTVACEKFSEESEDDSKLQPGNFDPTYSGERHIAAADTKPKSSWLHSNKNRLSTGSSSSTEMDDYYSKPYSNTHATKTTGLFRIFDTSSQKSTNSNVSEQSIYVNEEVLSSKREIESSKQTGSPISSSPMAPVIEETERNSPINTLEENDDIYENVWIPPSKRTFQKKTSKEKMSVKSASSTSSFQSYQSDVFVDSNDDIDEADEEDFEEDGLGDWSDFDSNEEFSDVEEDELREGDKLYNIVRELTKTEESYVFKIGILVKAKLRAQEILKNEDTKDMFPYIDIIHKMHEGMLQKFKLRIKTWETNRSIGDLVTVLAPHLKMYTDYVKQFEVAQAFVDKWIARSKDFAKMLKDVVSESQKGKLDIKTYMLEPVQRVPRYQLLLEQYLKHMPKDDEEERKAVEAALKAVTDAANHFQFAIKQKDQIYHLIELQKYIDIPIINPDRELKKRGPIHRLAVRSGKLCARYIFLFNDLLLICREMTVRVGYTVQQQLPVDGMEVLDGENPEYPYMVIVKTRAYVAHFQFDTEEDKLDWLKAFWKVIADRTRNRLKENNRGLSESIDEERTEKDKSLGKVAPVWVHDNDVSMCMLCAVDFSLTTRKHHCRACGCIMCSKCSTRRLLLEYDKQNKRQRVCDECFLIITDNRKVISNKRYISRERQRNCCLCSGEMKRSANRGKTWDKYWVEVHEGGMVYCFRARLDICAYSSQDMGGCTLELVNFNNQIVFQLECEDSLTLFKVDEKEQMLRWLDGFEGAMKDSDAMHFRVDEYQRSFIESTTKRDSKKSSGGERDNMDKNENKADDESINDSQIKSNGVISNTEMDQSDPSQVEITLETEKDQHIGNAPQKCDIGISTDISETVESSDTRTIGVQVIESELSPSKKRIKTLIARLYKDTNQQTDGDDESEKVENESATGDGDPVIVSQIGRNATMYNKCSFNRGCQTQSFDNVFLRRDHVDESSEC